MIRRLRFWLLAAFKRVRWVSVDGNGYHPDGYNPFTDRLVVRHSRFGYVTHHSSMSRSDFRALTDKEPTNG